MLVEAKTVIELVKQGWTAVLAISSGVLIFAILSGNQSFIAYAGGGFATAVVLFLLRQIPKIEKFREKRSPEGKLKKIKIEVRAKSRYLISSAELSFRTDRPMLGANLRDEFGTFVQDKTEEILKLGLPQHRINAALADLADEVLQFDRRILHARLKEHPQAWMSN